MEGPEPSWIQKKRKGGGGGQEEKGGKLEEYKDGCGCGGR